MLSYDCAVASIAIEMAHEMRHVEQYDVAKGKIVRPDDMPVGSMWSLVASCDNHRFSKINYNHLLHEIDAEKIGVLDSVDVLCKYLGESVYKQAISQALRRSNRLDISPVKYGVVPKRFSQDWFLGCIDEAVELSCVRNIDCLSDKNSLDFAVKYFLLNKQDYETFKSLADGFEQDVYLAKMNIDFNENQYGFFDRSSLSFSESVPEPCGGRVNRPVMVQSSKPLVNVEMFNVVSASDSSLNKDDRSL